MFNKTADLYDQIYSFKDYEKESLEITDLIQSLKPNCQSILDLGCGTAEHHKYLKQDFQIDGLDINKDFILVAQQKNPEGAFHFADMTDFELGKTYDAIICLFSSIGYVKTIDRLASTLQCIRRHLNPGGLVIIEPWLTPETWYDGKLHMLTYNTDDIKICRMNQSQTRGILSIIHFHYLVGTSDTGVSHFEEIHELALFTKQEMIDAFQQAGFKVRYDAQGITGRGIYSAFLS
ncbi:MAG: class I SAM-dependent methyltransferase [Bacteroidia bacterium]|nr:class I SAM-dependent methyltransferase [Bacteroidia bacterium]